MISFLSVKVLIAAQAASRCPLVHVHNFHQQFRAALQQLLSSIRAQPNPTLIIEWQPMLFPTPTLGEYSHGLPVRSDTMSWQILSCGRPKPAAFSTILRSLTVGA